MSATADPVALGGAPVVPRWGLGDAAAGWLIAESSAVVASSVLLGATGHVQEIGSAVLSFVHAVTHRPVAVTGIPLWMVAVLQAFLWVGLLGAPLVATRRKGNGPVRDLGLRFRWTDLPLGVAVGVASQFVLVPLLSLPWIHLLGRSTHELDAPARELADKAHDPLGVILLVLIVVIGAPLIEELFFRGLVLRSYARRRGPAIAVGMSALVFGFTHFELLQFPALTGFGVVLGILAVRTGRLGPGIFAHLSFNAATVIALLLR